MDNRIFAARWSATDDDRIVWDKDTKSMWCSRCSWDNRHKVGSLDGEKRFKCTICCKVTTDQELKVPGGD
jgi:transposase-like protein